MIKRLVSPSQDRISSILVISFFIWGLHWSAKRCSHSAPLEGAAPGLRPIAAQLEPPPRWGVVHCWGRLCATCRLFY